MAAPRKPPSPIGGALEGDPAALEALLRTLAPTVVRACRAVLGPGSPDVDDAAQEALVGLARALPAFRGEASLTHYACRIAARTALRIRRHARAGAAATPVEEPSASAAEPTDSAVGAGRRRGLVRELLESLPEAQAETFALRVLFGYSLEEVAELTAAPVNTVRSRMRLAREAMRARLESDPRFDDLWREEAR